ncbi:serine hydrolase [Arthrobacter sp. PM3]|uniref:serine hydrolase domain-containing protein n=1 Tax=Arthrobacter sp. PM3 TaxID=2017685 RepID=UPI000E107E49|nr:serine hydrolase domain-containing protein [Arthrobacter sp. PM3]AXJ10273.1 D-alanyl-D-alanine carboxypeptidase [Arthrobacter sp. PM3]
MSVTWIRGSTLRLRAAVVAVLLTAVLGGCSPGPEPPVQPTPSEPGYRSMLEDFGTRMLDNGAPAVLIQLRLGADEWSAAYGVRTLDGRARAAITDPVHIGGITKSMVAVTVLKLVEEGRLELDAPVSTYLPEFNQVMHPPGPVTVRQLLQHRSGMPSVDGPLFDPATVRQALTTKVSLADLLAMAGRISWQAKLAQGFEYSNSNYIALALIVERLRGRRIGEVIRTDIIEPLGLDETLMTAAGLPPADMVHGYITLDRKRLDVSYPAAQIDNAAAGMVSSMTDVNNFYRALLQNRLLKAGTVTQMESPLYARYALGVVRWNDLCTNNFYYGHPGDVPGYGTIALTSADGTRQLAMAVAYPPQPLQSGASRILHEMEAIAVDTLNATCQAVPGNHVQAAAAPPG